MNPPPQIASTTKPFILTIFGASGDLAKIKIFPALYAMAADKKLPKDFFIFGFARTEKTRAAFQDEFKKNVIAHSRRKVEKSVLQKLVDRVHYFTGEYDKALDYEKFTRFVGEKTFNKKFQHVFYFSVPPSMFRPIIRHLGESRLHAENKNLRLVIEKPFGEDAASALELFHFVARYFADEQIFLLDHYLGKSAVQSIFHLRHSNRLLNQMLKGPEIANIQITAFEKIGVEDRVGYFDQVGMLKDMVQSHLLQVLALITMSIPVTERSVSIQKEKYNVLSSLNFIPRPQNVVLGQYRGYRKIKKVPKNSIADTFAALRVFIDRESWWSVPIYIRTGKMMRGKHTYVTVELKKFAFQKKEDEPNRIIIELQPDEKITIKLINKHRDGIGQQEVITTDSIACGEGQCLPEHAALLLDVLYGDKTYFLSFPEIIAAWQVIDGILGVVKKNKVKTEQYADGSEGPKAQHALTKLDGFSWYDL